MTEKPQILQGCSAVRSNQDAWGDCLLDIEITAITEKILTTPLKVGGNHAIGQKSSIHLTVI